MESEIPVSFRTRTWLMVLIYSTPSISNISGMQSGYRCRAVLETFNCLELFHAAFRLFLLNKTVMFISTYQLMLKSVSLAKNSDFITEART